MSAKQQTFSMKDLACEKVVVFKDRAEVKRAVRTRLKKGENELVISGVTNSIDRDSVRVEGHGQATVLDVVCQSKRVDSDTSAENTTERIKELKNELDRLESQQAANRSKLDKVTRQIAVLNEFANTLAKPTPAPVTNSGGSGPLINSKESVDNFLNFIDSYAEKFDVLSERKQQLEKDINKLEEQIQATRENLNRLSYGIYSESIEIVILLECSADDSEVNLHVSYLVYSASWSPKYDIRVFNKEKEKSMTINYYGMISQTTGEDWVDTKISLSTAVPSVGGNVPELETVNVRVKEPVHIEPRPSDYDGFGGGGIVPQNMRFKSAMMAPPMAMACMAAPPIQQQVAKVQTSSIGSTSTYDIPRSATIPSDNNTHKVSIGIIELKPEFEYESVPKKSLHAYIKAKVTNASEYALLAGPASVFLDNNFVAKTELKSYSPQEEFHCSLGVDPSIKVEYKPIKKFKAQSGLISKSTTTTYVQVIELKNTSPTNAKVLLVDSLPLSNDDKIQVKLLEPVIKKETTSIRINKQNNLEFDLNLASGKTEEITIKYSIEHPSDKEIEIF